MVKAGNSNLYRLDWNLLRTYTVIVRCGSISRASEELCLTQPAVSNALRRLEDQIGYKLIRRGGSAFEVTTEGRILYAESMEILAQINRMTERLSDTHKEISGMINLKVASHIVYPAYDKILMDFHRAFPNITFKTEVTESGDIANHLLQKNITAGIGLVFQKDRKIEYQHLFSEYYGFYCGKGHRLFGKKNLDMSELQDEDYVSFQTDNADGALWPIALLRSQLGLTGKIVAVSPNVEEVRQFIAIGMGIGPLPIHVVQPEVERGILWRLPPYTDCPKIDNYIMTNKKTNYSRAETLFLNFLKSEVSALAKDNEKFPPENMSQDLLTKSNRP